jgi:broad specificity phosphatase PhoE
MRPKAEFALRNEERSGSHSGATAPELHRLLRFISKTDVTLGLPISSVKPTDPMNSSRVTFISHAATEAQRRAAFPLDEPVLEHESGKITELKWKLPAAAQVWSAPEQRTQQTSRALGLAFTFADELRDCDYGRWRGRKMDEVQTEEQEGILAWLSDPSAAPHGGESLERLGSRVGKWMEEQRSVKHTIAVTHPAVIRAAVVCALQVPVHTFWRIDIAPLTVTDLRFNNNVWTLRSSGCHLREASHGREET